jgi:hypothetical protein
MCGEGGGGVRECDVLLLFFSLIYIEGKKKQVELCLEPFTNVLEMYEARGGALLPC